MVIQLNFISFFLKKKRTDLIYNHITARIPGKYNYYKDIKIIGTEYLLINPFGLLFSEITASSLIKVIFINKKFFLNILID